MITVLHPSWASYDGVAGLYSDLLEKRLAEPAGVLLDMVLPGKPSSRLLDVGTGTGGAAEIAVRTLSDDALVVGIDVSHEMLSHARRKGLRRLARADACRLPFASDSFDIIIANFVLSHLPYPVAALTGMGNILTRSGRVGATAWEESPSEIEQDWRHIAKQYIPNMDLDAVQHSAVPSEQAMSQAGSLSAAFEQSGLRNVVVTKRQFRFELSLTDHLLTRGIYSTARFMRSSLSSESWRQFEDDVAQFIRARHPDPVTIRQGVLFALGFKV